MKSKIILSTGIAAIMMTLFIACGGNNSSNPLGGCNGGVWSQQINDELTALSEASEEFYGQEEPTIENCEAYKDALRDYVDALEGVSSACIPAASEQEYQESISEARQEIDEIDCAEEVQE